jgi:hypothetical protein
VFFTSPTRVLDVQVILYLCSSWHVTCRRHTLALLNIEQLGFYYDGRKTQSSLILIGCFPYKAFPWPRWFNIAKYSARLRHGLQICRQHGKCPLGHLGWHSLSCRSCNFGTAILQQGRRGCCSDGKPARDRSRSAAAPTDRHAPGILCGTSHMEN